MNSKIFSAALVIALLTFGSAKAFAEDAKKAPETGKTTQQADSKATTGDKSEKDKQASDQTKKDAEAKSSTK